MARRPLRRGRFRTSFPDPRFRYPSTEAMRLNPSPILLSLSLCLAPGCIVAIGPGVSDNIHGHESWWQGKRGSGDAATQTRDVAAFRELRLNSSAELSVEIGAPQSISVTADDNLVDDLVTEVRDGVLHIGPRPGASLRFRVEPRVVVRVPSLEAMHICGSGDALVAGVGGGGESSFAIGLEGSGNVTASGTIERLSLAISGSGDAELMALSASHVIVAIQGSGNARLFASQTLTGAINGSGDVEYRGGARATTSINGSGSVQRIDG